MDRIPLASRPQTLTFTIMAKDGSKKRSAAQLEEADVSMAAAGDESVANITSTDEPKKKKSKKDKSSGPSEEELIALELCPIAHPLANAKMAKKVLKCVKKGQFNLLVLLGLG